MKFGAGGICGSDMHYFRHARTGDFVVTSPLILGHEVAGEIVEIAGDAPGLAVGDHVAVNPSRWCGSASAAAKAGRNLCENIYFMGSASKTPHMQGGFASLFDATLRAMREGAEGTVRYSAAALAEPLAVALHAVARAGDIGGPANVALFGAGPIGLSGSMLAARLAGAGQITMIDIAAAPLAFAKALGADRVVDISGGTGPLEEVAATDPVDVAFEISGTPAGLGSAIRTVRRGGTVVLVGNLPGGDVPAPANAVMAKELDMQGDLSLRRGVFARRPIDRVGRGRCCKTGHGQTAASRCARRFPGWRSTAAAA